MLRLRYEDIVARPVEHFERVLEHFDLPMTKSLERQLHEWVDPGRQNKWRRLDRDVILRCLPMLEDDMIREGYALPDLSDDPGGRQPGDKAEAASR